MGKELESSPRGGLLDFTAQADATLFIQLHDLTYAGGPEFFYRLQLSKGPRLDFIFPSSGQAGSKGKFTLYGRGLPGGARSNPANTYRLCIRKEAPDFRLAAVVEHPLSKKDDRTAAPRGLLLMGSQTIAIKVIAFRRDNFTGDIELTAEGLPADVKCIPSKIEAGKNDGMLLLTADEKVAASVGAIHIFGKAKVGDRELRREARGGAVVWPVTDFNVDAVNARLAGDFMLAVNGAEAAPISIDPAEDKVWEAPAGGKIEIPLRITRRGEFKEALKLKSAGTATIDALKEIDVDAKATTATTTIDLKAVKIPAGTYTIYVSAQTKGKFAKKDTTITVYSAPIRIAVK